MPDPVTLLAQAAQAEREAARLVKRAKAAYHKLEAAPAQDFPCPECGDTSRPVVLCSRYRPQHQYRWRRLQWACGHRRSTKETMSYHRPLI